LDLKGSRNNLKDGAKEASTLKVSPYHSQTVAYQSRYKFAPTIDIETLDEEEYPTFNVSDEEIYKLEIRGVLYLT
jgi:hypothetical protein